MTRLPLLLLICGTLFPPLCLRAQVEVSTSLPATTFLQYEGIPLRVEITNRSGDVLRLGAEDTEDLLMIRVRDMNNRVIPRTKNAILDKPWVIPDGETSVRTFDLVQLFMLQRAVSYRCLQDVKLAGDEYAGRPLLFDVVPGLVEEKIKRRKADRVFTMFSLHRGGRDELMLRVTDFDNTMVLATYYLERHLKFYDPFMKVDKDGALATLHYISPHQVVMCRFKPDGTPVGRTYYTATPGVPVRMAEHPDGGFMVQGAVEIEGQGNSGSGGESGE